MENYKGFYIHAGSKTKFSGVNNKIRDQIEAFSEHYDISEIVMEKEDTGFLKSIAWRLPGGSWGRNYDKALNEVLVNSSNRSVLFFYIRYSISDWRFIMFLSRIRELFPLSKIVLEFPTYPYDKELSQSATMWPWFFKDRFWRRKLSRYVDRIVTYSGYDSILGIPTIKTINGINLKRIRPILSQNEKTDTSINMLAVAQFQPSHGYERIIRGIASYYLNGGTRDIKLHMVGEGPENEMYKRIVKTLGLDGRVVFYGSLTGKELDQTYENKDIGLGALGMYKRKLKKSSVLKVREYLAKGLPVVCGAPDDAFLYGGRKYCIEFENDPGEIDVGKILKWYDDLLDTDGGRMQLIHKIRDYAEKNVDVSATMAPVIGFIEE